MYTLYIPNQEDEKLFCEIMENNVNAVVLMRQQYKHPFYAIWFDRKTIRVRKIGWHGTNDRYKRLTEDEIAPLAFMDAKVMKAYVQSV